MKQASEVRTDRTSITWPELLSATITASLLVALIWIDAYLRGAVGIPRDDDWSYLRTIFTFAETGTFTLNGWVHMMYIGQAVPSAALVQLAGPSVVALQAANALMSVIALVLIYFAARQLLGLGPAAFVTATLAVSPVFAHLVVTAMTDIPVLALQAGCVLCGLIALRHDRPRLVPTIGVLLCGMAAFTIREYGAVVLLAVAAVLLVRYGRDFRESKARSYTAALILLLIGCALVAGTLWAWRRGLPYDIDNVPLPVDQAALLLARAAAVLALMVLPAWCAVSWSGLRRAVGSTSRFAFILGGLLGVVTVAVIIATGNQVLGNIIHPFGSTWTSVGDGIRAVPLILFRALQVLGYVSLVALSGVTALAVALYARRFRRGDDRRWSQAVPLTSRQWQMMLMAVVALALLGSYVLATGVLGAPLIDRYFLLVAPLVVILLLAGLGSWQQSLKRRVQTVASLSVLVGATFVGAAFVDASAQIDGARWRAAQTLVQQGIEPSVIDAGDPWFRYHQQGPGRTTTDTSGRPWWVAFFPDARACWTIVLTRQQSPGAWGPERTSSPIRTLLGEEGRLVVVSGPDVCTN